MPPKDKSKTKNSDKRAAPQLIVGIDLGTTNSALAYATPAESGHDAAPVSLFNVPQLVNPGEVAEQPLLPSFLYIPGTGEFVEGSLTLPWDAQPPYIVGSLAQKRGAENVNRLVASAKSWLSSQNADPAEAFLPLDTPEGFPKDLPARSIAPVPAPSAVRLEQEVSRDAFRRSVRTHYRARLFRCGRP